MRGQARTPRAKRCPPLFSCTYSMSFYMKNQEKHIIFFNVPQTGRLVRCSFFNFVTSHKSPYGGGRSNPPPFCQVKKIDIFRHSEYKKMFLFFWFLFCGPGEDTKKENSKKNKISFCFIISETNETPAEMLPR